MGSTADGLAGRIKNKKASIGIVGMGYVGIPLGLEFARNGFTVTGFDKDLNRVKDINAGKQVLEHIPASAMREFVKRNDGYSTNEFSKLSDMDCVIICVPTPLDEHEQPDMSYVSDASGEIGKNLKKGQLIILESTTYPGTTREVVKPILEKSKLKAGKDFFLAYSPEREDPGNKKFSVSDIPKVMGGLTNTCLRLTKNLYKHVVAETVEVSSLETAEATKLMENVFRAVNIAMVNELKLVMDRMGINIWEVVDAAKTKPFGFMPFYPGPGMGGHCIPIDPFYLSWKAKEYNTEAKFIELAGEINRKMTEHIAHRIGRALNDDQKSIKGSKILIVGVAYKKDIDDVRESPALRIMELLEYKGAKVGYHDTYVKNVDSLKSSNLTRSNVEEQDAIVIATDHTNVDYQLLGKHAQLIIDTRNVMATVKNPKARVLRA